MKTKIVNYFSSKIKTETKSYIMNPGVFDTSSKLLNSYKENEIASLLQKSAETKKNKGMSVRDALLYLRSV